MMLSNSKAFGAIKWCLLLAGLVIFCPLDAFSQDDGLISPKLSVGVVASPPVYLKTADNQWAGLGVEIWQAVAQRLGVAFEFREFGTIESCLNAIEKKEIDVVPSLAAQARFESMMEFSQSYLKSGLSIAVPFEGTDYKWIKVIRNVFSTHILKAIGLLLFMSLIFGIIVWSFERRHNSEMFGDALVKGVGHGIWWALVTMTTVGYGDKTPKTAGGRTFALVWMMFSLVFIAAFTATITARLTVGELRGKVHGFNDLYEARVGCLEGSEGSSFLAKKGIAAIAFKSTQAGLSAVDSRVIDAFVQDEKILNYLVKTEFPGRIQVVGGTFDEYFVAMALQQDSPLRKPINKTLLQLMKTENWYEILNRYVR